MLIIPAIDIKNRKCVRLLRGNPEFETVYSNEPVFQAKFWEREGAKRLHVVDLDGAFEGKTKNFDIIQRIIEEVNIEVEVGGGIRDNRIIRALRNRGVHKIIIGTAAVENKKFIKNLCKSSPGDIIVSIDAADGFVVKNGWKEITNKRAIDIVKDLEEFGVQEIIYTDIMKDGTLEGPNYDSIETMLTITDIPIIVSGGISSLEDIKTLKEYEPMGLKGVIIGKALYEGRFKLSEAMQYA
ncbi:MAG: 1-(5-phosphoribosyl)-5-[(5-phosphoribosylamino)methylideneamino]imidazole-4-carboxamide isomerase [Brevinematia bacterium]